MLSSPRNGASTLLNTTAEGSDPAEEELLDTEAIGAGGSSLSPRVTRRGLLLGALLLGTAAAAALLLVGAPWGAKEQLPQPHGSDGLQTALRAEQRFGFLQLRSDDDEEEMDGDDDQDDKEEDGDDEDDVDADSDDQEDGEYDDTDGDEGEEGDEADEDGEDDDDEEAETTTSTLTTTTVIGGNEEAHDPHLVKIDKDGDGKISDREWQGFVDSVRHSLPDIPDEVDKNLKDYYNGGELNNHELEVLLYHLWFHSVEKGFKTYDKNGDGLLEKAEIRPYAKELEDDFGLSSQDFNDVFDAADKHEDKVLCAKEPQDVTEEWTWDECTCLTPDDSKLSLCEVPGLLHAINLHFKKKLEKS